jgi:hypothetical protein
MGKRRGNCREWRERSLPKTNRRESYAIKIKKEDIVTYAAFQTPLKGQGLYPRAPANVTPIAIVGGSWNQDKKAWNKTKKGKLKNHRGRVTESTEFPLR